MQGGRTSRAEAERLIGIAEKLLHNKDFHGSKDFALLAQETEPLLDGPEQILAVAEVHLAADKRINNHPDWYSVLQVDRRSNDFELIKKQYRRLALLLHPDKNKFAYADSAFKLVADAWAILSDPTKKSILDNELGHFSRVDLVSSRKQKQFYEQQPQPQQQHHRDNTQREQPKLPVKRGSGVNSAAENNGGTTRLTSFWTVCPYCYNLFEFARVYEGCCLRCQNCNRAFTAAEISSMPPFVPGRDEYYCSWGFFPMGFMFSATPEGGKGSDLPTSGIPNDGADDDEEGFVEDTNTDAAPSAPPPPPPPPSPPPQSRPVTSSKKRGRPRKIR